MPFIQPEHGMPYEFDVEDFFQLPDGSITFVGKCSRSHNKLYPAMATLLLDGTPLETFQITAERMSGNNSHGRRIIVSYDKVDMSPYKGKSIKLICSLES